MRTLYREQIYEHGDYATVSVYPVFRTGRKRGGRYRPTSDVQQRLNDWNRRERLGRQLDANFMRGEVFCMLSFDDEHLPKSREAAKRTWRNFARRLERKTGGSLRYAAVFHGDAGRERLHVHAVIGTRMSARELQEIWGQGYVDTRALRPGKTGYRGIAEYMLRGMNWGRVMTSRNLTDPAPKERTGRISRAAAEEIAANWDDRSAWSGSWPGYEIADVRPFYNWFNRQYYLRVYLYKPERLREAE